MSERKSYIRRASEKLHHVGDELRRAPSVILNNPEAYVVFTSAIITGQIVKHSDGGVTDLKSVLIESSAAVLAAGTAWWVGRRDERRQNEIDRLRQETYAKNRLISRQQGIIDIYILQGRDGR